MCEQQGSVLSTSRSVLGITKPKPNRLKVRVTRLESVVERLAKGLPQDGPTESHKGNLDGGNLDNHNNSVGFDERREPSLPIYALFRNEVVGSALCMN